MKTILIVDDSLMTRMMIESIISSNHPDWTIIKAKDAEDALNQITEQAFDYATVDMNMPGITGLELIPKLQIKEPMAKIALVTANIQESIQKHAALLEIEVINKPINEQSILNFVGS